MDSRQKTIALVDDDPDFRNIVEKILESAGYQLRAFDGIDQLVDYLKGGSPDLILLDLRMKEGTSVDFLKDRIDDKALLQIPVVVVSAVADKHVTSEILSYKVTDYLVKPVTSKALLGLIKKTLFDTEEKVFEFEKGVPAEASTRVHFVEVSESKIIMETPFRISSGDECKINSEYLKEKGINGSSFVVDGKVFLDSAAGLFRAPLKLRGISEALFQKIRKDEF